jgi:hypothetical protein
MAHAHTSPNPSAEVRLYLHGVAKFLVDRLYGPSGPALGTTLTDLEQTTAGLQQCLAEHLLKVALTRQAEVAAAAPTPCPSCQQPTLPRPPEPRVVKTTVGDAEWLEPHHHCPKCRKAFFPSVQEPRT